MSSFYLDILKDRLYTLEGLIERAAFGPDRQCMRSSPTLVRLMAPVLSFTADEVWGYMKGEREDSERFPCRTFPARRRLLLVFWQR